MSLFVFSKILTEVVSIIGIRIQSSGNLHFVRFPRWRHKDLVHLNAMQINERRFSVLLKKQLRKTCLYTDDHRDHIRAILQLYTV